MNSGKIPEHNLEKAVLKNIQKVNNDITVNPGIGTDYSLINGIITADGVGCCPVVAFAKAFNNFACSGGVCEGARISMFLSESTKESKIASYMEGFSSLLAERGIQILGGNTEIIAGAVKDCFQVFLIGHSGEWSQARKAVTANSSIIMVGYAGILGTNQIIFDNTASINERFGNHFSTGYVFNEKAYLGLNMAELFPNLMKDVRYIHDISAGGVYTALWQLGKALGKGIEVINSRIPIKQETIELSESIDQNPYLIDGTGAMLIVCDSASALLHSLREEGYVADIIGHISTGKERVVLFGDDEYRTLAPLN